MAQVHVFWGNLTTVPAPDAPEAAPDLDAVGAVPRRTRAQAIRENRAIRGAWASGRCHRESEAPLELRMRADGGAELCIVGWDDKAADVKYTPFETYETAAEVAAFKAGFHLKRCPVPLPRRRKAG